MIQHLGPIGQYCTAGHARLGEGEVLTPAVKVTSRLVDQAVKDIDKDRTLTAQEKLDRIAKVMQTHSQLTGKPVTVLGHHNSTGYGRTFGQSFMRTLGRRLAGGR